MRGQVYDEHVKHLEKCIKSHKDLEFLESFQSQLDTFKHSGYACRKGQDMKQLDSNSIVNPQRNVGFGNVSSPNKSKKSERVNWGEVGDLSSLITNNPKMDAKRLGDMCVKLACREHGRQPIPRTEPTDQSQLPERPAFIMNRQASFQVYSNGPTLSRQTSLTGQGGNSPGQGRQATSMQVDIKNASSGRLQFVEPTVSVDNTERPRIIRPSSSAPAFKRVQAARRGHKPFAFEVPPETMVEIRCMLHPQIKRDWHYNEDSWFPGMMTRTKELKEKMNNAQSEERRTQPKQFFQTKMFKYNEADVQEARSKPIVRCASAYMDPDRIDRQKQLAKDKHIICKRKVFDKVLKKEKVINVPFYTLFNAKESLGQQTSEKDPDAQTDCTGQEYRPVSSHKFREKNKSQWVVKSDFKLF